MQINERIICQRKPDGIYVTPLKEYTIHDVNRSNDTVQIVDDRGVMVFVPMSYFSQR